MGSWWKVDNITINSIAHVIVAMTSGVQRSVYMLATELWSVVGRCRSDWNNRPRMERLTTIFHHLSPSEHAVGVREVAALPNYQRKGDDIVVVSALRTPITRAKRGSFKVSCVCVCVCLSSGVNVVCISEPPPHMRDRAVPAMLIYNTIL